ncbi:MAG TPA: hypothetical protein V6C69_18530 [Trichormus sp.]|jgi:hypothetical protein
MPASDEPVHIRELEWLAHYYDHRGFKDKAQEINSALNDQKTRNIIAMFEDDDQECRA